MIFKYSQLKNFLNYIHENYKVTPLCEWNGSNGIILRHDVDLDIKAAYDLALLEKECNVRSTFFILTTCYTYNPLALDNRNMLKEMSSLGFEIGLHFDPMIYGGISGEELQEKVDYEAQILGEIISQEIASVSLHNPSIHGKYPIFDGYYNAYEHRIFSPDRYLSDSRMQFRHDIYKFVERARELPVQILLHPMHYTEEGITYPEIFKNFISTYAQTVDTLFKVNSTYGAQMEKVGGNLFEYIRQTS